MSEEGFDQVDIEENEENEGQSTVKKMKGSEIYSSDDNLEYFYPDENYCFHCPLEECSFASRTGFIEIRNHLPSQHFSKQILEIAKHKTSLEEVPSCQAGLVCSLRDVEESGDLVYHYGVLHCITDQVFQDLAETLLISQFGQPCLDYTCPYDDFICNDRVELLKHLTFGHYYKLILEEVKTLDISEKILSKDHTGEVFMEFKCPLCTKTFGKSEFSDTIDINALISHFGSDHCFSYYHLLSDKSLSKKKTKFNKNLTARKAESDVKLEVLENDALTVYLSPEETTANYGVKMEPSESPYSLNNLTDTSYSDQARYRPIWTIVNAENIKAENSFGISKVKNKNSSPRRNYQQFYRKEDDKWICLTCETRYDSTHGIHYHLNHTTCGFGDKEKITPKKDFRGFYLREDDKFICLGCDQRYDTIRGVHYHLSNKKCGSEVKNKVGNPQPKLVGEKQKRPPAPKKNYLQFYKKEDKMCICSGCGTQYQSVHGMHNHLNSTKCGFGDKFKSNPKTSYTQFYRREEDKLICIACEVQYNSMHGMHYHLNSTKCGFGAKEKVTPKKNYQEFYTKFENSFVCNKCNFKIEYLQGIHRHIRSCCDLSSGMGGSNNGSVNTEDEEDLKSSNETDTNFFEANMNYIGHDETL